jgi:hypothetical protein
MQKFTAEVKIRQIECYTTTVEIEANSEEEAKAKLEEMMIDDDYLTDLSNYELGETEQDEEITILDA